MVFVGKEGTEGGREGGKEVGKKEDANVESSNGREDRW